MQKLIFRRTERLGRGGRAKTKQKYTRLIRPKYFLTEQSLHPPDLLAHVDILLPSPGCALLSNHTSLAPLPVDVENLSLLCASPPLVREFFSFLLGCVFRHAYQHTHTRCARSLRRRARLFHVSVCACDVTRNSRLPFTPRAALPQFLSSSPFAHRLSLSTGC